MNIYLYQNWLRGYKEMQSEEDTLWYYADMYKPKYNPNLGDIEVQKKAHKFLKTCTDPEEWAKFAYEHELQFKVCKMDGTHVEACLYQDFLKDIGVCFLDDDDDVYMIYTFRKEDNGKYFLMGISFWEWTEDKKTYQDYTKYWNYTFETNGNVQVVEWEKGAEEECVWTSKRPLNVERNWEEKPEFGDWEGFFQLKRWKDGELDEAFKGEGAALAYTKTNYPYKELTENDKSNVAIAIKQAEQLAKDNEVQKAIQTLEDAFYQLPKPKENYQEAHVLILKITDYNIENKNFDEATRIIEKLEKYLNLDNEIMLPLYKGKVYFEARDKTKAREQFDLFIQKNGDKVLMNDYPEYYKIYRWYLI